MTESLPEVDPYVPVTYCANHPDTETTLRCNRCEKPICAKCAIRTPTGYRCEECVRGQQKVFETALAQDYIIAILIAGILSFLGSLIVPRLGFFTILLAPGAGAVIAEAVRRAIRKRRSQRLFQWTAAAVVVGSLFPICTAIFGLLLSLMGASGGGGLGFFGFGLIWQGLYTFMAASTAYYRLSGIQL